MNPKEKIQGRKTSKKANRKTKNSVEITQWEKDKLWADKIINQRCQKKELEPTISIPHPEDEVTKKDLSKLVELHETSDDEKLKNA